MAWLMKECERCPECHVKQIIGYGTEYYCGARDMWHMEIEDCPKKKEHEHDRAEGTYNSRDGEIEK